MDIFSVLLFATGSSFFFSGFGSLLGLLSDVSFLGLLSDVSFLGLLPDLVSFLGLLSDLVSLLGLLSDLVSLLGLLSVFLLIFPLSLEIAVIVCHLKYYLIFSFLAQSQNKCHFSPKLF